MTLIRRIKKRIMAWLRHVLNKDNALVNIEDVKSGRSALRCPYCEDTLTAKKGRIKEHHFAHTHQTCAAVIERTQSESLPRLPLYTAFALDLGYLELEELLKLWQQYGEPGVKVPEPRYSQLIDGEYLRYNRFIGCNGGYEFTKLGKLPVGGLSVPLFADIQKARMLERLYDLEDSAWYEFQGNDSQCDHAFIGTFGDYRLYSAQLERLLSTSLYYLQIDAAKERFYKIGVTTRTVEERVSEIEYDLQRHIGAATIKILGHWATAGRIEHYFKHRFSAYNKPIGSLSEYFSFDKAQAKKVLRELQRLKSKRWPTSEQAEAKASLTDLVDQVSRNKAAYEQAAAQRTRQRQRAKAISAGLRRAAQQGQAIGRPRGDEADAAFLAKPKSQKIIAALEADLSLRKAARRAGASVNTVRKVRDLLAVRSPTRSQKLSAEPDDERLSNDEE